MSPPLLYTMELWSAGFIAHPYRLATYVLATLFHFSEHPLAGAPRFDQDGRRNDSVEEMGKRFFSRALVLFLCPHTLEMRFTETAGLIWYKPAWPLGVSVARRSLGRAARKTGWDEIR